MAAHPKSSNGTVTADQRALEFLICADLNLRQQYTWHTSLTRFVIDFRCGIHGATTANDPTGIKPQGSASVPFVRVCWNPAIASRFSSLFDLSTSTPLASTLSWMGWAVSELYPTVEIRRSIGSDSLRGAGVFKLWARRILQRSRVRSCGNARSPTAGGADWLTTKHLGKLASPLRALLIRVPPCGQFMGSVAL